MPESKHPSFPGMHSVYSLSATTHARSSFWLSSCLYSFNNDFLLDPAVPRPPTTGTLRNYKHTSNCPIRCSMSSCTASLTLIAQSVARQLLVECNRGNANGGSSHFPHAVTLPPMTPAESVKTPPLSLPRNFLALEASHFHFINGDCRN